MSKDGGGVKCSAHYLNITYTLPVKGLDTFPYVIKTAKKKKSVQYLWELP